jgi:hypothetical protein
MLNYAEELILLAIDDDTGSFYHMTSINLHLALVGALLMDLANRNRIGVESDKLSLINLGPTGDKFLDQILQLINEPQCSTDTATLVRQLYNSLDSLREKLLESLEEKGIIRFTESKVLWLFKQRRYPVVDNREEVEVKTRIRSIICEGAYPEPRDIAMLSLLYTCDLMDKVFSSEELGHYQNRIESLRKKDLIGQAVNRIIGEVQAMISSTFIT